MPAALPPEEIYEKVSGSVLTLQVENSARERFVGSAFLALRPGLAVTAWHVVHDAQKVEAWLPNRQRVKVLGLVAKDEKRDLAVLAVETIGAPQTVLTPEVPRVGARAYVIGAPRGLECSISDGLVSQVRMLDDFQQYQLSCPISPGNSGGPVVNDRGEIMGIVSWRKADAQNLGFAIPVENLLKLELSQKAVGWQQPGRVPKPAEPEPVAAREPSRGKQAGIQDFQQALSACEGRQVTVTLEEGGASRHFTFEVPVQKKAGEQTLPPPR